MSERSFYFDAYTTRFQARVIERVRENERLAVILNKTYFYPVSGGQPADLGRLNDTVVTAVTIRETDGAICHWLGGDELWRDEIEGTIDWSRRFDHMQQHTGQHILSQAFIQVAEAPTASFHLSENSVTIDLEADSLTPAQVEKAEFMANQIIWQNRPVHVRMVSIEDAHKLPLRNIPPARNGQLRLIEIEKFDLSACGGTHVRQAGEVGMVKIVKLERQRGKLRVEFCCGQRALLDFRLKNSVINHLTNSLTTGIVDLVPIIEKLQQDNKQQHQQLKRQNGLLNQLQAESMLAAAEILTGETVILSRVFSAADADPGQLRNMANIITQSANAVIMLGLAGAKSHLLFARTENAPGEMNLLLKQALQLLDGAGGGTPAMAQGGGKAADAAQVEQAILRARRILRGQVK